MAVAPSFRRGRLLHSSMHMSQSSASIQPFEARRVRYESPRSYDDVLEDFQRLVDTGDHSAVLEGFSDSVRTREDYENVVRSQAGESEFMLFASIDHGKWLNVFGIQQRVMRLIFGNPLTAITMMRHDLAAGLFAPVEMLIVEKGSGDGSIVVYDLPSSMMRIQDNPAMLEAAWELDRKLQTLVSRVTGVESPRAC